MNFFMSIGSNEVIHCGHPGFGISVVMSGCVVVHGWAVCGWLRGLHGGTIDSILLRGDLGVDLSDCRECIRGWV